MNPNAIIKNYVEAKTNDAKNILANMLVRQIIGSPVCDMWQFELPDYSEEKWAPILGFEGLYEISNVGRLKKLAAVFSEFKKVPISSKPREIISSFHSKSGNYLHTYLRKNNERHRISIHIEVAKAFVPNPENKPYVNHKDGYKDNPRWDNLEWSTTKENNHHARATGLNRNRGEQSPITSLTSENVMFIISSNLNNKELGKMFGINSTTVGYIRTGKTWRHLTGIIPHRRIITPEIALAVFNSKLPYTQICLKYGVKIGNVNAIKSGVSWSHITGKSNVKAVEYRKKRNLEKKLANGSG